MGLKLPNIRLAGEEKHRKNLTQKTCPDRGSNPVQVYTYKTIILPVVLYGCETWALTLRDEHRLRVLENKLLREILGAKINEITGEWKKIHNAELHELFFA